MKRCKISLSMLILLLFTLNSCLYNNNCLKYSSFTEYSEAENYNYGNTKDNVTLYIRALNNQESKDFFGTSLLHKGYMPLYLKFINNTPDKLTIRPSYIDVKLYSPNEIAKELHYDTSLCTAGVALPAFLYWWPALVVAGTLGYDMYSLNQKINKQILALTLYKSSVDILPYEQLERFIFLPTYVCQKDFKIKVFNEDKKKIIVFPIQLIYDEEYF